MKNKTLIIISIILSVLAGYTLFGPKRLTFEQKVGCLSTLYYGNTEVVHLNKILGLCMAEHVCSNISQSEFQRLIKEQFESPWFYEKYNTTAFDACVPVDEKYSK